MNKRMSTPIATKATRSKTPIAATSRTPVSRGYLDQAIAANSSMKATVKPQSTPRSSGGRATVKPLVKPRSKGNGGR